MPNLHRALSGNGNGSWVFFPHVSSGSNFFFPKTVKPPQLFMSERQNWWLFVSQNLTNHSTWHSRAGTSLPSTVNILHAQPEQKLIPCPVQAFLDTFILAAMFFKTYTAFYLRVNLRNNLQPDKFWNFAKQVLNGLSYTPRMTTRQTERDALPSDAQRCDRSLMQSSNIRNLPAKSETPALGIQPFSSKSPLISCLPEQLKC